MLPLTVVGTDVEDDGEDTVRVDACSKSVERGLGRRDGNSADTLVANTQNRLRVSHDDEVDRLARVPAVVGNVGDAVDVREVRLELGAHAVLVREGLGLVIL